MEHLVHFDMVLGEVFDLNDLCVEKSFLLSSIEELSLSSLSSHRLQMEHLSLCDMVLLQVFDLNDLCV